MDACTGWRENRQGQQEQDLLSYVADSAKCNRGGGLCATVAWASILFWRLASACAECTTRPQRPSRTRSRACSTTLGPPIAKAPKVVTRSANHLARVEDRITGRHF